ncbi:MAG: COG2426 family protein [Oscillospiraceae bacterium]
MIDSLSLWLHESAGGEFLLTMLVSMTPVLELRGGLPFGVALGLPVPAAFLAALIGNMLPVPLIILFARQVFRWIRRNVPRLGGWVDRLEKKAWEKGGKVLRYQAWGLLFFVALPLPGTGAWTGALIAALLDMRLKKAVPVIFVGVLIAGSIVTVLTYGVVQIFA